MTRVSFVVSDFRRDVTGSGALVQKNRFYEKNPFLSDDGAALISRPGLRRWLSVGEGPIRGMKAEPGSFDGNLFVASGGSVFRVKPDQTKTSIITGLYNPEHGVVNMAITAQIGTTPEYLFVADGRILYLYLADSYAHNELSGSASADDVVVIGTMNYKFTSGSVDTGTPDGSSSAPWLVAAGDTDAESLDNLAAAVNIDGTAGTQYSTDTEKNDLAQSIGNTATQEEFEALTIGTEGNGVVTTTTSSGLTWADSGGTMVDGGTGAYRQVNMPDDIGVIDVAVCNSFVVVIPVQTDGYIGRFYWIEPGDTIVKPLNFATAERSPDGVNGVKVFGDQFWLPGDSTTEVWYFTGDAASPVSRVQGVVIDRGSWANTACAIHESMLNIDADGGAFLIRGSEPERVSTPDIEEEIRKAMAIQQAGILN